MDDAVNRLGDMSVSKIFIAMQFGKIVNIEFAVGNVFNQGTVDPGPSGENVMRRRVGIVTWIICYQLGN